MTYDRMVRHARTDLYRLQAEMNFDADQLTELRESLANKELWLREREAL